jgi:aconitate hydratase
VNSFTTEPGTGIDKLDGSIKSLPDIARHYRDAKVAWVAIGDENYGEGSSREHAAMEPRYMNCKAIITRSFARIHETNLKKQGVLPLTFADPITYDKIGPDDTISIVGLASLTPDQPVQCRIHHADGTSTDFQGLHTMSPEHIEWFKAGGALNVIRQQHK